MSHLTELMIQQIPFQPLLTTLLCGHTSPSWWFNRFHSNHFSPHCCVVTPHWVDDSTDSLLSTPLCCHTSPSWWFNRFHSNHFSAHRCVVTPHWVDDSTDSLLSTPLCCHTSPSWWFNRFHSNHFSAHRCVVTPHWVDDSTDSLLSTPLCGHTSPSWWFNRFPTQHAAVWSHLTELMIQQIPFSARRCVVTPHWVDDSTDSLLSTPCVVTVHEGPNTHCPAYKLCPISYFSPN